MNNKKSHEGPEESGDEDAPDAGTDEEPTYSSSTEPSVQGESSSNRLNSIGMFPEFEVLSRGHRDQISKMVSGITGNMDISGTRGLAKLIAGMGPAFDPSLVAGIRGQTEIVSRALESLRASSPSLLAVRSLHYPTLRNVEAERTTAYSEEMTSSTAYFEQWESTVNSFEEFQRESLKLMDLNPQFTFLWRGQRDAAWPLHSSLFREIWRVKGVAAPDKKHRRQEPFPTEQDMVNAEAALLEYVRENWRFEDASAMSMFARLQHFGAPTRLLDVSRNPLIAAWFAVEEDEETDNEDCRIFALATSTLPEDSEEKAKQDKGSKIDVSDAKDLLPFWHLLENDDVRAEHEWGTGRLRRFWIPPLYESRIAAQNAGFILDGVPLDYPALDKHFRKPGSNDSWKIADRLATSSISARFSRPGKRVGATVSKALPPSFTFRVTAQAKQEIRRVLRDRYSYNHATIYPDIQGAAHAVSSKLKDLIGGSLP